MSVVGFALFETSIGRCGIAWSERGIAGVQLPQASERATTDYIRRRFPGARTATPPVEVRCIIDDIVALLEGEPKKLDYVQLDLMGLSDLQCRVYQIARAIPPGSTSTYGEIAQMLGNRSLARDIGEALGQNPFPIIVPCHRVLSAGGKAGGFSARGGVCTKLLSIEGAQGADPMLFDRLPWAVPPRNRA